MKCSFMKDDIKLSVQAGCLLSVRSQKGNIIDDLKKEGELVVAFK